MSDREELKVLIREVLAEIFAPTLGHAQLEPQSRWSSLKEAWEPLGYPSYSALYKDVKCGLFRVGKELCNRRKPGAKIARHQIDMAAARRRLAQDPSKRRGV